MVIGEGVGEGKGKVKEEVVVRALATRLLVMKWRFWDLIYELEPCMQSKEDT